MTILIIAYFILTTILLCVIPGMIAYENGHMNRLWKVRTLKVSLIGICASFVLVGVLV